MFDLDWKEIEILRAVSRGHDTAQKIRPFTDYSSHDAVRHRCAGLAALELLRTWKETMPRDPKNPRWCSRAKIRYYALTDLGDHVLKQHPIERTP